MTSVARILIQIIWSLSMHNNNTKNLKVFLCELCVLCGKMLTLFLSVALISYPVAFAADDSGTFRGKWWN